MSLGSIISGVSKVFLVVRRRFRRPQKSTVEITMKALIAATKPHTDYLQQKTSVTMESAAAFWDKNLLRKLLLKINSEEKEFVFYCSDSKLLAQKLLTCFILPNHGLKESEIVSILIPIFETSKEIFIEYLLNDDKAMNYNKLRDSRLLDVIAHNQNRERTELSEIVANLRKVPQEKSVPLGFRNVSNEKLEQLSKVYVPPAEYDQFYFLLVKLHLLIIVGQSHVGKSSTAYMLAQKLSSEKNDLQILEAVDYDSARKGGLQAISGSIVIFDDLFGEADYEFIGSNLKFIRTLLSQKNYIIMTSREYIFEEAKIKTKVLEELPQLAPEMLQEGSYRTVELEKILVNHVRLAWESGELGQKTENLIYSKKAFILNELRFPHNIEMFVKNCKLGNDGQIDIRSVIEGSKKITDLVKRIIEQEIPEERCIFLLCALLREVQLSQLKELLSNTEYSVDQSKLLLKPYQRLMIIDKELDLLKYKHPSFREAVIKYFEENELFAITSMTLHLMEVASSQLISLKPLHNIILKMTRKMEISKLEKLFMEKDISVEINTILFSNLVYMDPAVAVKSFLKMNKKQFRLRSPLKYIYPHRVSEALDFIAEGLKTGEVKYSKRLERLVSLFLRASIEKTRRIYNELNLYNKPELKFKVSLLAPICHEFPLFVFWEIRSLLWKDVPGDVRASLYGVLSVFPNEYVPIVLGMAMNILSKETDTRCIRRLKRVIFKLKKIHSPELGLKKETIEFLISEMEYQYYDVYYHLLDIGYDGDTIRMVLEEVLDDKPLDSIHYGFYMEHHHEFWQLSKDYGPKIGLSDTVEGKLIMAIETLRTEAQENKNSNWSQELEQHCEYLRKTFIDASFFKENVLRQINNDIDSMLNYQEPYLKHDLYDRISDRIVELSSELVLRDLLEKL